MKWWALPSFAGDFRLIANQEPGKQSSSQLLLLQPTPHERQLLQKFMTAARAKKWTREIITDDEVITTRTIELAAPLAKTGPALVKATKPLDRTLTAVSYKNGKLEVAEVGALETLVTNAGSDPEAKAVSVARPTPCCPRCVPGSITPANDVLQAFLSPQEHADWAEHRAITVVGGQSGHRYLLAHRNSPTAVLNGKICYDLDDYALLHFHDTAVPPEEEILAAKLILEHREPWLRNEATVQYQLADGTWRDLNRERFKNPFGDAQEGMLDAAMTAALGVIGEVILGGNS